MTLLAIGLAVIVTVVLASITWAKRNASSPSSATTLGMHHVSK